MEKLTVKGIKQIEDMKFHDIEGGFGEGKKAMLVKDIAKIHGRDTGRINEAINRNKNRFKNNVDFIDLKESKFAIDLCESGIYTKNSVNASSNIYLLSERGYAKLLKILEDDVAWDQYEKLVDGYFNMRKQIPKLSKELQAIFAIDEKQQHLDNRLTKLEDNMTIDHGQACNVKLAADMAVKRLCCGNESAAYQNQTLRRKIYSFVWRSLKSYFNVTAYHNILRKDMDKAINYVSNLSLQGGLLREVQEINNQMCFGREVI